MSDQKTQYDYFDQEFLDKIKNILLTLKQRLEDELDKFATKNPKDPNDYEANFPEYGDKTDENVQEVSEYLIDKPLEITLEKSLRDVNNALKRLEEGTYGICKYCGKPMKKERLLARPTSSACVSCKKMLTDEA